MRSFFHVPIDGKTGEPTPFVLRNQAVLRRLAITYKGRFIYQNNHVYGRIHDTYWDAEMRRDGTLAFDIGNRSYWGLQPFENALKELVYGTSKNSK